MFISTLKGMFVRVVPVFLFSVFVIFFCFPRFVSAQTVVEKPDKKFLFIEDQYKKTKQTSRRAEIAKAKQAAVSQRTEAGKLPFDISAPVINYDSTGSKIFAEGGLNISYGSTVIEAERGEVDLNTNDARIYGDVRIADATSDILCDEVALNLKTGAGKMQNAKILFEDGDYRLIADEAIHEGDNVFSLKNALMTTCDCPDAGSCSPWRIHASRAKVTREGYGQVWNATLDVNEFPVFYTPYLIFPAKTERQSGFLPFQFGTSKESGFKIHTPFFWAIDQSTDATITGVFETNTRNGFDSVWRKVISKSHELEVGLLYFDERVRKGDLQGTNIEGLFDPKLDQDRVAGYWDHSWRGYLGEQRLNFVVDAGYVSDDLLLREYENDKIAPFNSRFVTSTALLNTVLAESYSLSLSTEYNQALVTDDDLVFQRLPEVNLTGLESFDVFGPNSNGLKLLVTNSFDGVNFSRGRGYEGTRAEVYEKFKVPFYYKNYLDGDVRADFRATQYDLGETDVINSSGDIAGVLPSSSSRFVPGLQGKVSTVLERVYDVEDDSFLKSIVDLGPYSRTERLARVKHTLEPTLQYRFVPKVNQKDNPQFDAIDRLAQRNVVTYGLTQRLFARFDKRDDIIYGIEESAPEIEDLDALSTTAPVDPSLSFGYSDTAADYREVQKGSVRELGRFVLKQSFDVIEQQKDLSDRSPFSDLNAGILLLPNHHVRLLASTDYNLDDIEFSAYNIETQLIDKRGDELRARLRFIGDSVRQLETGVQFLVTEQVKFGYYSRYDDITSEFIENRMGLRFISACNCWMLDMDISDKINPNQTSFTFNFTLIGLGEFGNTFFSTLTEKDRS
jgi:LPS-assembly protein